MTSRPKHFSQSSAKTFASHRSVKDDQAIITVYDTYGRFDAAALALVVIRRNKVRFGWGWRRRKISYAKTIVGG